MSLEASRRGGGPRSPRDWKMLRSEVVLSDEWIHLESMTCQTPAGAEIAPYYVIGYPDWVHVFALDDQARVLLVRQYRQGIQRMSWELPGGCVDPHDASPVAAAERELLEETGHAADRFEALSVLSPNSASQTNLLHAFMAHGPRQVQEPKEDPREELEFRWVDLATLAQWVQAGEFTQALHLATLLHGLQHAGVPFPTNG